MSVPPPGPRSRAIAARLAAVESPALDARRASREKDSGAEQGPIVYASGRGANVTDVDGNRYVDLAAGFGALLLGHGRAEVLSAVEEQQRRLGLALGDVYASEVKLALCERVAGLYPEPRARVMLGSSGADAVTAALKTAMLATGRAGVVAFEGAYHGLSYGPLAACGLKPAFREPFAAQLNAHVTFAPYPEAAVDTSPAAVDASMAAMDVSLAAVQRALAGGEVGAVVVEPILGRGGCMVPPAGFLAALRAACDASGALLVCDEIWTGLGRSGAWLASLDEGVLPDVVCLGKGLGGGLPLSACLGSERAMAAWGRHGGTTIHTATHFGAPPACAAALATLDVLEREELPERARAAGAAWMERLRDKTSGLGVREVRGRGLMVGVALEGGGGRALAVARTLLARGWIVLTGGAAGDVLTLTPPLDVDGALLDAFAEALAASLSCPHETSVALAR
jgi:4-aminobutyrate aminotransferase / (S)-3-amino-2-methylpropionate transaminase / 5-aminovalerate transaminase